MSVIQVYNNSKLPIHGALSWAGTQQQAFNALPPEKDHSFQVGGGWHDLTIVVGGAKNQFDTNRNNQINWESLLRYSAAVNFFLPPQLIGLDRLGVSGAVDVDWGDFKIPPVQVTQLYAPDSYTIDITGGEILGTYNKATKVYKVTYVQPLYLSWHNRQSNATGGNKAPGVGVEVR